MSEPVPFRPPGPGGERRQIEIPRRLLKRIGWGIAAAVLVIVAVAGARSAGDRTAVTPRQPGAAPIPVLQPGEGEAAVMLRTDVDVQPGAQVRVIITPRGGQGIAHILPGRVLAIYGRDVLIAVQQDDASRHSKDFSEGRAVLAVPGEPVR